MRLAFSMTDPSSSELRGVQASPLHQVDVEVADRVRRREGQAALRLGMEAEAQDRRRIAELREVAFLLEQWLQVHRDAALGEHAQAVEALE